MFKNTFLHGLIWGFILPVVAWTILYYLDQYLISINAFGKEANPWTGFKPSTIGIMALCANLLVAVFANRRMMEEFIRGLMFPTVLAAFGWLFYFDPLQMFGGSGS